IGGVVVSDRKLDITIQDLGGDPYWVINGLDTAQAGMLPALPLTPSLAAQAQLGETLTPEALAPVAAEAVRRWSAADPTAAALLAGMQVVVADLNAGGELGGQRPGVGTIDDDAAGLGWFVDPTPGDDKEFSGGAAPGGVDLLTVVMHELGHQLGRVDLDGALAPNDIMNESLGAGVRRGPAAVAAP